MKIVIGLGNPGEKYTGTRHNIGFYFVDKIRNNFNFPEFSFNKKFNAETSSQKFEIRNSKFEILLIKPQTFMNLSGDSIKAILDFYKLTPEDILVIQDDLDIPLGEYKIATDSRSAGHNGVQDIIEKIGTQTFTRLRIGVGKSDTIPAESYVLQKFSDEELEKIKSLEEKVLEEIKKALN